MDRKTIRLGHKAKQLGEDISGACSSGYAVVKLGPVGNGV